MFEVKLIHPSPEGSREIPIEPGKTSFGRGSDVDRRFADDGLSRRHATVYNEGGRVWIIDENSANGTYVNGVAVQASGTPLVDGDSITIGHETVLRVRITESKPVIVPTETTPRTIRPKPSGVTIAVIGMIALSVLVVTATGIYIGYKVLGGNKAGADAIEISDDSDVELPRGKTAGDKTPVPASISTAVTPSVNSDTALPAESSVMPAAAPTPSGKKYAEMSDTERRQYLGDKAMRVAQVIGNRSSEAIPPAAIDKIKGFADGYASRSKVKPLGGCRFGDNLQVTFERASRNAPFIVRAFNDKGIDPRIGLYLAMIESEHCVCLQSPTGPLGMFQFTRATAEIHGLKVIKGASTTNPDERCEPEPSARAAASYMKALTGRYGTGPASVPLAIGSYNSGEGGLSSNLQKALDSNQGLPRDFWTLIANGDKLSKQFQSENFKYVPKFFAAAIIGENPQDFGLSLQPLSTYSK